MDDLKISPSSEFLSEFEIELVYHLKCMKVIVDEFEFLQITLLSLIF